MTVLATRRHFLASLGVAALAGRARAAGAKTLRGVFPIMSTPYTEAKALDFEDLAHEVEFLDRCGAQGMVWPQMASEYWLLSREERMHGMEVLARAARGKRPALILGVQGPDTETALAYARHAESLQPDGLIAMPPSQAKSLDDYRAYYHALAGVSKRPFFIQTTGGAKGVTMTVDLLVELANEFPNFGYVKEELEPAIQRMKELGRHRPPIKGIFSGSFGKGMMYEARLGFDGTMPGAEYADIHAQVWEWQQAGQTEKARDLFGRLLMMIEVGHQIPGARQYILKKRGVFKTTVSRLEKASLGPPEIQEIDFSFEALKPYLRA
ncbi:MAG TPA: dihydrodipicolinate synthase family protein [Bryobacteraceae bacterium]|nr:dihydrodipicolinate synthase family protein [Bryobacteraceae bacterium]